MYRRAAFAIGLLIAWSMAADAADITILCANGARPVMSALAQEYERKIHDRVIIKFEEPGIIGRWILDGEPVDLVVLPAGWDQVRETIDGTPVGIAHAEFGILAATNAPKPDTSADDAVRRTLLAAKSIAYADPQTGAITGVLFVRMIERLGIADEVKKKSKIVASRQVDLITRGEADLAVAFSSAVVDVPGTQFASMPPNFQTTITFSGAIAISAKQPVAAKALLQFFTSPSAAPIIKSKGYEPG